MNEITRARIWFLGVVLLIVLVAHLLFFLFFLHNGGSADAAKPVEMEQLSSEAGGAVAAQAAAAAQEAVPEKASSQLPEKRSFWSRLFSWGKSAEKKPVTPAPAAPPKPVVYRYKKPTGNPNFAKPFDYSSTIHGDLAADAVPGSSGARSGILVDLTTRKVLWEKNSRQPVPVASMVKMMTLYTTFEVLEKVPGISLETPVQISPTVLKVPRTGIIWLDPRETFPLGDLLKAVTIKSANDAATMVAEFIGNGDVNRFILAMNGNARELGMTDSKFVSPNGLKDPQAGNSLSSARDMVLLAEQLLEYPPVMQWTTTKVDYVREGDKKTVLTATNHLVNPRWPGVDGMKTGYTSDAGYCLTFTVLRDGRRMVGCVTGFKVGRDRDRFCRKLIDWGYARATQL